MQLLYFSQIGEFTDAHVSSEEIRKTLKLSCETSEVPTPVSEAADKLFKYMSTYYSINAWNFSLKRFKEVPGARYQFKYVTTINDVDECAMDIHKITITDDFLRFWSALQSAVAEHYTEFVKMQDRQLSLL